MTTRPQLGQRQPQRSLSSNLLQRQPPLPSRTLAHQPTPSSPARRNHEGFADPALGGPDAAPGRLGAIPRNGGSNLRVETSRSSRNPASSDSARLAPGPLPVMKPPRGRPHLHFDVPSASNRAGAAQDGGSAAEATIKPMPLPVRPGRHPVPRPDHSRAVPGTPQKKDARPKPYALEVPAVAARYSPDNYADFFPWTGNHPEDKFSEAAIRQGFYDKAQLAQNETGSGRSSILPPLKHKSGLQALSTLFTSVLAQRRAHGQITSNSTFKPPPRVTVTDTKREIWLKDLANPTIPLRRLSRSIPHGIRGKVLLDQSLSKNIPIERAVWLAKCVGANELRSFRRKGASGFPMGGEGKWIREFTVCVEQFVENIVESCGCEDFKSRVNYAIRLSAQFHAEHLLDRDHYMDWLIATLEHCKETKLPMWLLITQVYWKDILQYRKYGRRLAAALLDQWVHIQVHPDSDILAPLSIRLRYLLKGLMASHPESFVASKAWPGYSCVMRSSLAPEDNRFEALFTVLDQRNGRLSSPNAEKDRAPRKRLIGLLDATLAKPFRSELLKECLEITTDTEMLAHTVLEWSTSLYRPGVAKVYVAARLVRRWAASGTDITQAILSFLDTGACDLGRNKPALYHLVSELARSDHFSVSMYLQWLIARGGVYEAADIAPDGPCSTRLLVELPSHLLTESLDALRRTLLGRANHPVDAEEEHTSAYMSLLSKGLSGMQPVVPLESGPDAIMTEDSADLLPRLGRGSKSEIGFWLRQTVGLQMLEPTIPPLDNWDASPIKGGTTSAITLSDFNVVRQALEDTEDLSILADILKLVSSSSDAEVLASCVDTIHLHLDSFAAIGALNGLFEIFSSRLRILAEDDSFPRVLLVSLSDLAIRIPGQQDVARQLGQEVSRSDRKTAADACSPVSDHMAGVTQPPESDFTDEIEKVLASGNSMDQTTMERLFQRITVRLKESWEKMPEQYRSCGLLLTRLRAFDASRFDPLMSTWVNHLLQMETRPSMIHIFGPLVSFGCLSLEGVIASSASTVESDVPLAQPTLSKVSKEALALLTCPPSTSELMTSGEVYRLRIKQANLLKDSHPAVLSIIQGSLKSALDSNGADHASTPHTITENLLSNRQVHSFLQTVVLLDTDLMIQRLVAPLLETASPSVTSIMSNLIDKLLVEGAHEGPLSIPIETVLNLADDLTLPFCRIKLTSMFFPNHAESITAKASSSNYLQEFDQAVKSAVAAKNTKWTCIIPVLDVSIAQRLREQAESQFISIFLSPKSMSIRDVPTLQRRAEQAVDLLFIINTTKHSIPNNATNPSLASDIVTILDNMLLILDSPQTHTLDTRELIVVKWLPLALSFASSHISAFTDSKAGHESRFKAVSALAAILLQLEAIDNLTNSIYAVIEETYDLALYLVDALPEDLRQQCVHNLRDVSGRRISYIFSIMKNPSDWLVLSQRERVAPSSGGEGRGTGVGKERLVPYPLKRWEMLGEPTPNIGENDTSLSLTLFGARRD